MNFPVLVALASVIFVLVARLALTGTLELRRDQELKAKSLGYARQGKKDEHLEDMDLEPFMTTSESQEPLEEAVKARRKPASWSWLKPAMAVTVSLAIGGSALYIILSLKYGPEEQKWAYGAIGMIVGFWLKPVD